MSARRTCHCTLSAAVILAACGPLAGRLLAQTTRPALPGGQDCYLTHVSTDKPIYRPGEKVYIRGVILRAVDHAPLEAGMQLPALIEIRGPKGDVVASGMAAVQESVAGFAWEVPAEQAGGEYTVRAIPVNGWPPGERKFDIRAYRAPRLKNQIVFLRDGYGPGDEAAATLHTERAEGGIPAGAKVTIIARVDGQEVFTGPAQVDAGGNVSARFTLPREIARGEGTLAFVIEDGGVVETAAKTIPILLQTVDLTLYPEGGDLVAGLPTRVYLEAKTPARKPADIAGIVTDGAGRQVASFRTEHEGRGRFSLTPARGATYTLRITEPTGIKTTYPLPAVKDAGAVIQAVTDQTARESSVGLRIAGTSAGKLKVTLTQRQVELAAASVEVRVGEPAFVALTPPSTADGVLVATVYDAAGTPLAERLVYRQPARSLRVKVAPEQETYVPGDTVRLAIETTDERNQPVGAVVGVTVTDDSVLEMIEKREQAPRLPVMVLLESDVRELADAHVYLDDKDPKAPLAVDLLLGTQGWRRFALVDKEKFVREHGDAARRVLALAIPHPRVLARFKGERFGFAGVDDVALVPEGAIHWNNFAPGDRAGVKLNDFGDGAIKEGQVIRLRAGVDGEPEAGAPAAAPVRKLEEAGKQLAPAEQAGRPAPPPLGLEGRDRVMDPIAGALLAERVPELPFRGSLAVVRVYAHDLRPDRAPGDRVDFMETLYWNAGLRTDEKSGKATVSFALSDAVTTFRVFADGFDAAGGLGQAISSVESVEPFYIEPKLPLEVTAGDHIRVPIGIVNGLSQDLAEVTLTAQAARELEIAGIQPLAVKAKGRQRCLIEVGVGNLHGPSDFVVHAQAGPYSDKVTRRLSVKPLGFPVELAFGGTIGPGTDVSETIVIPDHVVSGSLVTSVAVYPTPLANMTAALERLIQEPNGCFEQTSSMAYPLVMAQQYFTSHTGIEPALIERSRTMLDKGYARLASFECKQKGYEWFGADPGHEALSAYGLMEFTDMAQVRPVDAAMVERTRQWLMKRRDGKGGFLRDAKVIDSFGHAPPETTNAYITWALLEAKEKGLDTEVRALGTLAESTKDSYILALAANVLALNGDMPAARKLMGTLAQRQNKEGCVEGAATSITRSGGEALNIETTSLAVLAWLRDPAHAGAVEKASRFLAESCKAGRFGSTQSTVLALRAIVGYDKARATPKAPGSLRLYADGKPVGEPVSFTAETQGAIQLPDVSTRLSPGRHTIEIRMTDGSSMPYALAVNYYDTQPASAAECKVGLDVALNANQIAEGAVMEANVTVTNRTKDGLPMPIAIVGLPGGLEPRHDQLKELVKAGTIAAYEVLGRDVVLYWRELKPQQEVKLPLSLVAAVPGTYTGPASRAYLYYTDEYKTWVEGRKITITPRTGD